MHRRSPYDASSNVRQLPTSHGLRLVIVIPALNEQESIDGVLRAVPRSIPGVRTIETVLVDDGSDDATVVRAVAAGVTAVVSHPVRRGLVSVFRSGMREAVRRGADVVVQLDGDGQHDPAYVSALVAPIVAGEADVVVGARPLRDAHDMSPARRYGNRFGSWVMRRSLGIEVNDATSGYRAYSRDALLDLHVTGDYTYTLETLIQAARKRLAVAEVVVPSREREHGTSRMTSSIVRYIRRSGGQAFRSLLHQDPLALFGRLALLTLALSGAVTVYFLFAYRDGGMHLPSVLAAVMLMLLSIGMLIAGLVADGINRASRLSEEVLYRLKAQDAAHASSLIAAPVPDAPLRHDVHVGAGEGELSTQWRELLGAWSFGLELNQHDEAWEIAS